jgi:hypothetical protein
MADEERSEIVRFLKQRAGDNLRGVAHYHEDGYELLYVRDDVARRYDDDRFAELFSTIREEMSERAQQESVYELGRLHCTVRLFDEGIVLNFSQGDRLGTSVSLDPEAASNLTTFAYECIRRLHRDSPQTVVAEPAWLNK